MIRDIPIPPSLQLRLDTLNIMRAVRGTTAIEGAQVSPEKVLQIIQSPAVDTLPAARRRDEQEVRNAQEVMFYVANLLTEEPDCPVTQDLICRLHELITKDIAYLHNTPGAYRSHAVSAGDYVPPQSGDDVRRLMDSFIDWFRTPPAANWPPVVRALAAHFYLISIHPFGDGNGRTTRALESFLLYQARVNARGFYSLANYYYQHRSDYIWRLDNARFNQEAGLTPFIMFGLRSLVAELEDVHAQVIDEVRWIAFHDYAREMFLANGMIGTKAGERILRLLMTLGREPIRIAALRTGANQATAHYQKVSLRTVQQDIASLRDMGLVTIINEEVFPNLAVMQQFTALRAIQAGQAPGVDRRT